MNDIISSSNLVVGETVSGSLSEIRGWSTALSVSKFQQHVLNKFSTVGNTINSHKDELIYQFKLNENYSTSSISSSTQMMPIKDASPNLIYKDYTIQKSGSLFSSPIYGFDFISINKLSMVDNDGQSVNDNDILINPGFRVHGDLSPDKKPISPLQNSINEKPIFKPSPKLEIYRSPQTYVNNFITDKISGFNLEKLYGDPKNYYSQSYEEFITFRKNFFESHPISIDTNKFIRAHENMFNHSIIEGLKTLVPARSTFSGKNSNIGVEIKPTILEKQKYENQKHSLEVNPNTFSSSIASSPSLVNSELLTEKLGTMNIGVSTTGSLELPINAEISLGNLYITSSGYLSDAPARNHFHPPFLQPGGYVMTIEGTFDGQINTVPTLNNSGLDVPFVGNFDYGSFLNQSYVDVHKDWGRTNDKVQHINFAAPTASDGTFNTYDIEKRFIFHTVGDTEYYSASKFNDSDFSDISRFYNRFMITDDFNSNINYTSLINGVGDSSNQSGRMMGKTRFFSASADGTLTLPRNHVTNFSQPFKDRMNEGTQNINPGFLNVRYEDYGTASFYRVSVTGGENEIYVRSGKPTNEGGTDRIMY